MRELERVGYETLRTAGSHGAFDVVAFRAQDARFIQIKRGRGITAIEREKLEQTEVPASCTREVWHWTKQGGRWAHNVEVI